ncbi:hypothetical protein SASPL_102382 [Salvia splendens]|uniref:Uncharacterized protein n=1 Tax=Salvia splendens TaxID=180675 RepID=A0A8X8YWL9_SALSN|nr:hypothetical protein SASPL_102382 [Salvia splendens]
MLILVLCCSLKFPLTIHTMAATHSIKFSIPNPICLLSSSSPPPFSAKLPNNNVSNFFGASLSRITSYQNSAPTLSRRLVLTSVAGIWDALTGGGSAREAVAAVRRGMLLFRQGDVQGSMVEFDKAIDLDPRQKASKPLELDRTETFSLIDYLWQRGLSLYYLDRFCLLPSDLKRVGIDPQPVMREAYRMFKDGGDPEKLVAAFSSGRESEYFYASLYAGLYYESEKKSDEAKHHLVAACKSSYGSRSDDYMASLAKVHCACRNWALTWKNKRSAHRLIL